MLKQGDEPLNPTIGEFPKNARDQFLAIPADFQRILVYTTARHEMHYSQARRVVRRWIQHFSLHHRVILFFWWQPRTRKSREKDCGRVCFD
jgi:hypothetical protein